MRKRIPVKLLSKNGQPEVTLHPLRPGVPELLREGNRGLHRGRGHPGKGPAVRGRPSPPARRSSTRVPPQAGLAHLPPVGTLGDEPGQQ